MEPAETSEPNDGTMAVQETPPRTGPSDRPSAAAFQNPHLADLAVVSVPGLLLEDLPLLQHLGVGEGDAVDPLERLHVRAALPVRGRVLGGRGRGTLTETIRDV